MNNEPKISDEECPKFTAVKDLSSGSIPEEKDITRVLTAVVDPEIQVNIVDLGLIYKIHRNTENNSVSVDMTLTSPTCPYAPQLMAQTHAVLMSLPNVTDAKINLVWSPRWDPRVHASEVAQMMLGLI